MGVYKVGIKYHVGLIVYLGWSLNLVILAEVIK